MPTVQHPNKPPGEELRERPGPGVEVTRDMGADVEIRAIDEGQRIVELSFSSETPVKRWYGLEILSHDEGAVDLSRLNEIGVTLYNHNRDQVLGKIIEASLDADGKRCSAKVQFDEDELSEWVFAKVRTGTLKGVSVGYTVDSWEEVGAGGMSANGRFAGPCEIAAKWMPYEISIVSVPADSSVGVGRSAESENEGASDGGSPEYEA